MVNGQLIDSSPEILSGTPGFRGNRVPVRTLTDCLAAGDSLDDFLDDFLNLAGEL